MIIKIIKWDVRPFAGRHTRNLNLELVIDEKSCVSRLA